MTRGVDRGLRRAADNAAYPIEEIDAGWDDAPTSVIVPVRTARQVSVTPTSSPWSLFAKADADSTSEDLTVVFHEEPTLVERDEPTLTLRDEPTLTLRDEPTLTLRDEPTLTLRDEPTLTLRDEPALALRDEPTPELGPDVIDEDSIVVLQDAAQNPSALDIPNFRRRPRGSIGRVTLVAALAFAVAGAGWHFTPQRRAAVATVPEPAPPRTVQAAIPAVASPAPSPPVAVEAPPDETPSSVTVVINVVPKRAVVFRGRERLGSGLIAVNVAPNDKQRLTAVLPGYDKARFTVDGTRDTVTIYLSRVAVAAPAVTTPGDSPASAAGSTQKNPLLPSETPTGAAIHRQAGAAGSAPASDTTWLEE